MAGEWALSAVWMLAVFMVLVQSTALITGERARQTLDVLMSTPMMTRDIVMQKMAGVHYLINILYVPMGTAAIFWLFWLGAGQQSNRSMSDPLSGLWQLVRLIVQPLIYLPLIAWGGFYCGFKCKSQTQAMLLGCVILAVLIGLPRVLLPMLMFDGSRSYSGAANGRYYDIPVNVDVAWSAHLIQIAFPCSSLFDARTTPLPYPYRGETPPLSIAWIAEILHWMLYGGIVYWLRSRAPMALTKSTQRAEAPIEEMALEAA